MTNLTLLSWNVNDVRAIHRKGFLPWLEEAAPDIRVQHGGFVRPRSATGSDWRCSVGNGPRITTHPYRPDEMPKKRGLILGRPRRRAF